MIAYFDTFCGASGDMILGALLDAGLPLDALRTELAKMPLRGYSVLAQPVRKHGLAATQFRVQVDEQAHHEHRGLADVVRLIDGSNLAEPVREKARRVFVRLAEAEAAVHGVPVDEVHFHEVGAVDSIVDVVGGVVALDLLGVTRIFSGPIRFGTGAVRTAHGVLPLPAPATARLAQGFPVEQTAVEGELTTPTGAAMLTTLAELFGPPPVMTLKTVGCGAGSRDLPDRANVLRVLLGVVDDATSDRVVILEANLDDTTPETVGYASEALFAAGALDVFTVPIQMKKSRPGVLLSVIARPEDTARLEEILFRETTTFGVRRREEQRSKLDRRFIEVAVRGQAVRVKLGLRGGRVVTASPEYDDCARVARETGLPLREVYAAARAAVRTEDLS